MTEQENKTLKHWDELILNGKTVIHKHDLAELKIMLDDAWIEYTEKDFINKWYIELELN